MTEIKKRGWATKWQPHEDEILMKYYTEKTIDEIMELLPNRNKKGIYSRAHKLGLKYHVYNENYFEIIDTEEKAYWLGFLYADGYVTSGNRWGVDLAIIDYNHLVKLNESLGSNIAIRTRIRKGKQVDGYYYKSSETCSLMIKNQKMYDDLVSLGVVPNKTYNISFPKNNEVPKKLMKHFIRGLFDGDGSYTIFESKTKYKDKTYIRMAKEISFVCKNEGFITDLQKFIEAECGCVFKIHKNPRDDLPTLRLYDNEGIVKFIDYLYSDANICLDRKQEKVNQILEYCLARQ